MSNSTRILLALPTVVLAMSASTLTQNLEQARRSLQGINDVEVVVQPLGQDAEIDGLTHDQLQQSVEGYLKGAGFLLLPTSSAYLYVNINLTLGSGIYIYCAEVELRQSVHLEREPATIVPDAVTWQTGVVGAMSAADLATAMPNQVLQLVSTFLEDFDTTNPGRLTLPPR